MTDQQFEIEEILAPLPEDAAFPSTSGQAFVSIPVGAGVQTFPLASAYVSDWLTDRYRERKGKLPSQNSLRRAIRILRSRVHCRPQPRFVDVRTVKSQTSLFIDLANPAGESVEITPHGWRVTRFTAAAAFRSTRGQLALPQPDPNPAAVHELAGSTLQNWLLAALQPAGPYPILVLYGPPGSGKTTTARMLRALIDPVVAPVRPLPSRGREVHQLAVRERVLVFDHVTHMSNSTADALCQLSSGTAVEIKEPGDAGREPLFLDISRPVILTTPRCGLADWQPRPDLAARIVAVELPEIANPRPPEELWDAFHASQPSTLSALYTALSRSLRQKDSVAPPPNHTPDDLCAASAAADPVFKAIEAFTATRAEWTGTASSLLPEICVTLGPRALSQRLRRLQSALKTRGIALEFHRRHGGIREIVIRRSLEPCAASAARNVFPIVRAPDILFLVPAPAPQPPSIESSDT